MLELRGVRFKVRKKNNKESIRKEEKIKLCIEWANLNSDKVQRQS